MAGQQSLYGRSPKPELPEDVALLSPQPWTAYGFIRSPGDGFLLANTGAYWSNDAKMTLLYNDGMELWDKTLHVNYNTKLILHNW